MRTYKLLSLILVLGIGFSACYDEDAIHTTKGDIPYELKEGGDEVDQYIYKFYQENGSIIMVDYDTIDYQWNMSGLAKNVYLTKQEDRVVLMKGFSMLEKTFLNIYDTDFKKKYFPLKLLIGEQVGRMNWGVLEDNAALAGLSYLALGKIREVVENLSEEELRSIRESTNGVFWQEYLLQNGIIQVPESFYEVSKGYYQAFLEYLPENEGVTDVDVRDYGFWYRDLSNPYSLVTPNKEGDFRDFMGVILTVPYEELKLVLDTHSKLKDKYDILVNYFKMKYQIDLVAIGNKQFK